MPINPVAISAYLFSFSPLGKWRTDDQFCWTRQGGLVGGWNSVLLENIQTERGGKRKSKRRKESWGPVVEGLLEKKERGTWSPGGNRVRADGREPHKLPSRRLGSSAQIWGLARAAGPNYPPESADSCQVELPRPPRKVDSHRQ